MAEQARRFEAAGAWLLTQRERFVHSSCPACEADAPELAWRKYGLDYQRCTVCETVYMSRRPDPGLLAEYYTSSQNYEYWNRVIFPASEAARRKKIFRPRAERVGE